MKYVVDWGTNRPTYLCDLKGLFWMNPSPRYVLQMYKNNSDNVSI